MPKLSNKEIRERIRLEIRDYVEQAKALNALETTKRSKFEYRVRGTPKMGCS